MPPKSSRKSGGAAASWYHCGKCDVHITSKDREAHEKICPVPERPDAVPFSLEFIRNGTLHVAGVERRSFTIAELSELPAKCVNRLVFISEGAMRLANFRTGQQVIIQSTELSSVAVPLVRTIWPIPEKFLTTFFAMEEDLIANWTQLQNCALRVLPLPADDIMTARKVFLQETGQITSLTENELREVQRLLPHQLKQAVLTHGSIIKFDFFNKPLQLCVYDWLTYETAESSLEAALEGLRLTRSYATVNNATIFEVIRPEGDTESAVAHISTRESDVGGLDEQLQSIREAVQFALALQVPPKGVKLARAMLLYGASGCGKTMICEAMCASVQRSMTGTIKPIIIRINTAEVFSKFLGETEKNIATKFNCAFAHYPQPSLIIVEDVHNLCPRHESNEVLKRVCASFAGMLDSLGSRNDAQRCFLLATTSHIDDLSAAVRRCGRLDYEVEICAPTPQGRADILRCLLRNVAHNLTQTQLNDVALVTHGFVGADLANLIYNASLRALQASVACVLRAEDVHASLLRVKPSAMREVLIESPKVRWSDIGGQAPLKLKLQQAIEWPLLHPEKFSRMGIKPPRGILMYGPPGCSKTMIAKALATESQLNFLSIKGPELFSMWVGESERAVRQVFRKARQVAPSIVFFDEIDAIGGERADTGGGNAAGTSVKERVLTQLLTELDGVEALENVTIIAATNRPDMIDKALLRPGRIDRIVYVGLPDVDARRDILRIKLAAMPLATDVDKEELIRRTNGYSGAEIQAVCQEAALKALEQSIEAPNVTWRQFDYALNVVQPRTSADLMRLYQEYQQK